ncbi:hypothetical protein VCHENC02_1876B, partial [Vibrio harveyi]
RLEIKPFFFSSR